MHIHPGHKIPHCSRSLSAALLLGLGVMCVPFLMSEETVTPPVELGFGKPSFGRTDTQAVQPDESLGFASPLGPHAAGFSTSPLKPNQSLGAPPLLDKPEWISGFDSTPQTSSPYLLPIQADEMNAAVTPTLPPDPNAELTLLDPNLTESMDEDPLDFDTKTESDDSNYGQANAGDYLGNLNGFSGISGYQIPPSGMPSGFSQNAGSQLSNYGLGGKVTDGLAMTAFLSGTYDTNPSQGYSSSEDADQGDFYTTLGGSIAYRSKASDWTTGALYRGSYNQYFKQTELSGYNQNAGASLNYKGGPLSAGLNVGVNFGSGANRYYAAVVDQVSYNYGLTARYLISPKTTVTGNFSQSLTSASGNSSSDTGSFTAGLSALWRYSALTEFGPGISYSRQSGSTQQDLTSIGPTLTVNYKLSSKVSLNSMLGLEFSEYEDGQTTDATVSANIGLNYRASVLWGMNLSLFRNVRADPGSAGQFQEITSLRLGYNRKIRRAQLNFGASIQDNTTQAPDSVLSLRPDSTYLTLDSSLSMPIFADSCNASIFMNYSDQNESSDGNSWDSLRTGFSISRSF